MIGEENADSLRGGAGRGRQAMPMATLGRGRWDLTNGDRQIGQKGVYFGRRTKRKLS
jgi:hypothetical protein